MNNKDSIRAYKIISERCSKSISVGEHISQQIKTHLAEGWELYGDTKFMQTQDSYDIFQVIVKR